MEPFIAGRASPAGEHRAGDAIAWATGARTRWVVSLDSLGRLVWEIRPSGRGETRYGYDLDGRLLAEERVFSGGVGRTENAYDGSGRLAGVTHADGSGESWTYRSDDQPATWTTRDGVLVTYSYDAANRLLSQVPTVPQGGEGVSVALDGGDSHSWDLLSRPRSAGRPPPYAVLPPSRQHRRIPIHQPKPDGKSRIEGVPRGRKRSCHLRPVHLPSRGKSAPDPLDIPTKEAYNDRGLRILQLVSSSDGLSP